MFVDRYAQMRNVFYSLAKMLKSLVRKMWFVDVRIVDQEVTSLEKQPHTVDENRFIG